MLQEILQRERREVNGERWMEVRKFNGSWRAKTRRMYEIRTATSALRYHSKYFVLAV